jgi:hypothetical protein
LGQLALIQCAMLSDTDDSFSPPSERDDDVSSISSDSDGVIHLPFNAANDYDENDTRVINYRIFAKEAQEILRKVKSIAGDVKIALKEAKIASELATHLDALIEKTNVLAKTESSQGIKIAVLGSSGEGKFQPKIHRL